jgi:hypothetical protein
VECLIIVPDSKVSAGEAKTRRRARAAEGVISNYGGLGWCDSTEQQLITGIAVCHRTVA